MHKSNSELGILGIDEACITEIFPREYCLKVKRENSSHGEIELPLVSMKVIDKHA